MLYPDIPFYFFVSSVHFTFSVFKNLFNRILRLNKYLSHLYLSLRLTPLQNWWQIARRSHALRQIMRMRTRNNIVGYFVRLKDVPYRTFINGIFPL